MTHHITLQNDSTHARVKIERGSITDFVLRPRGAFRIWEMSDITTHDANGRRLDLDPFMVEAVAATLEGVGWRRVLSAEAQSEI